MPTATVKQAFALALQYHRAGRLADAEVLYRQILAVQPNHAEALHHLGLVAHQIGRQDLAIDLIRRAVVLNSDNPAAHFSLGEVCHAIGRLDEAIASFRRVLELNPNWPEAHNSLGFALTKQGKWQEAVAAYRRALRLKPSSPEVHYNLGAALAKEGQLGEAASAFHRALALKPDFPEAHLNLGTALARLNQFDEAMAAHRRALALKPDYPEAHNNLGNALRERGRLDEAVAAYRRALACRPGYLMAHLNLGNALREFGRPDEAIASYRHALQLQPDYLEAHLNLGVALAERGQVDEALAAYRRALEIKPGYPEAHSNLVYTLHYRSNQEQRMIAEEQQRWNRQFCEPLKGFIQPHGNAPDPLRRLKIGYVSPDFRTHCVSFFFAPLLEAHDHRSYEVYCYASVRRPDKVTQRLRKSADVWREVRALSDAQLAECIRNDEIDILVDLAMHTAGNLLQVFARRPAPVQVSWLAYPGSTGLETIDYRLTDAHIDPADQEDAGPGERAVRLPDSWCCYAPIETFPPVGPLPAAQTGTVTFGSLNQFGKIDRGLLHCWASLLLAAPKSRLLMVCPQGQCRERTHALFATHGITRERVELVAPCPWPDYIRLFERIDVALDSYPCNGMTTTCHTLWMGVPVVTRVGTTAVSRAGSSLLHTLGLPELVAQSEEEYLRIASQWASDLPRLAELRRTLRPRMESSSLMDVPRFARNIETAYRAMWQRWCAEKPS